MKEQHKIVKKYPTRPTKQPDEGGATEEWWQWILSPPKGIEAYSEWQRKE
jgi:hypothetical protein